MVASLSVRVSIVVIVVRMLLVAMPGAPNSVLVPTD